MRRTAEPFGSGDTRYESNPSPDVCSEIAELDPTNPFRTYEYMAAMTESGWSPWAIFSRRGGIVIEGCLAFVRKGRLGGTLDIPSFPGSSDERDGRFVLNQALRLCRRERLSRLKINSFASRPFSLPHLPGETHRTQRREWVLPLTDSELPSSLNSKHAQSVKRARNAGVEVRWGSDVALTEEHAKLCAASMSIRSARGENVSGGQETNRAAAFVRSGAGRIYQAIRGTEVLSSMLVLVARSGAYEQSSGTSRDGRDIGASHFLLHSVSLLLQQEGLRIFNLGGAGPENPGLVRFKARFGTTPVDLEAAESVLAGPALRAAQKLVSLFRRKSA